jgi:hypothetical protein
VRFPYHKLFVKAGDDYREEHTKRFPELICKRDSNRMGRIDRMKKII